MRSTAWVLALFLIAGCGGSGGGGGGQAAKQFGDTCPGDPNRDIQYATSWGSSPSNASQVVQLYDAAGNVLRSDSLNRAGQTSSTLTIPGFASGVYEVRSTLYSLPDANGNVLGVASLVANLCGGGAAVNVQTTAAEKAQSLAVSPSTATVSQQQSRRFLATALARSGAAVFLPVGSLQWSVVGGIGTVSAQGVFTGTKAGTGQVTARQGALTCASRVTVSQVVIRHGKWTILVYMNAANDLAPDSDLNMNQMEKVAGNADVRFVVQWKESRQAFAGSTFDGVRRYLVKFDSDPNRLHSELVQDNLVDSQGNALDMGDPRTLLDFVQWGKQFYPADRYCLVVWNHGNGWQRKPGGSGGTRGFSYDDQYGTRIDTWQIDQALSGESFDILAWDASLMQMLEVAYEAREHAGLIAGSEESPPAEGYPYDQVFAGFRDTPDAPSATLAKGFVEGMVNNPPYANRKITESVLDTSKLQPLAAALDTLGHRLFDNKVAMASTIQQARDQSQAYSPKGTRYYRDLVDLCSLLKGGGAPQSVKDACDAVQGAVTAATVWEGHNAQSPKSHGIAIDFSPGATFQSYRPDYLRLKLAKDTFWDEFLGVAP